ncbi:MAG: hypothetical protein QM760_02560 [Nibricoccus sp.]
MPTLHASRRRLSPSRVTLLAFLGLAVFVTLITHAAEKSAATDTSPKISGADPARSIEAFRQVATVLRHPRCLNCHPAGDFPRQGDDRHRHTMRVVRGPDDHGAPAMKCSSCHQAVNQQNGVPGAPHWGLAPKSMAWEGLDDHELAEMLKDPARNGKRSLEQLFEHNAHDELVGWAWNPGAGRETPPLSREEFVRALRAWIDTGAISPEPAKK